MMITNSNADKAAAYYTAMSEKNIDAMGQYLHADVQLSGPLGKINGKEAILAAARKLTSLKSITIRSKFDSENQAMLVYDWNFDEPIGVLHAAVLMNFKDGLISTIELFFDPSCFKK